MSTSPGSAEYRDAWRGLRIRIPNGWQVRRMGAGIVAFNGKSQMLLVQPRPHTGELEELTQELLAWLRRSDPHTTLQSVQTDESASARLYRVHLRPAANEEQQGTFAVQTGTRGGVVTGYLVPAVAHEAASRPAIEALASLEAEPLMPRRLWQEESERAGTAVIPEGWHPAVQIDRANPAGVGVVTFRAWTDSTTWAQAGAQTRMFMEPGLLGNLMGTLSRGMVHQGQFVEAKDYVETYLLPSLRGEASEARVLSILPRPDLVPLAAAREAAASGLDLNTILDGQPTAVDALLLCPIGGAEVLQLSRIITFRMPPLMGRGLPMWLAAIPNSYQAPATRWSLLEPVLEGICHSFCISPAWQKAERERVNKALVSRLPNIGHESQETGSLLKEAERLLCRRPGHRLGPHERSFCLCQTPEEGQQQALDPLPVAKAAQTWRQALERLPHPVPESCA